MYYLKDMCCLCLNLSNNTFSDIRSTNGRSLNLFEKISRAMPRVSKVIDKHLNHMVCDKCCEIVGMIYEFNHVCLKNLHKLSSYRIALGAGQKNRMNNLIVKLSKIPKNLRNGEPLHFASGAEELSNQAPDYDTKSINHIAIEENSDIPIVNDFFVKKEAENEDFIPYEMNLEDMMDNLEIKIEIEEMNVKKECFGEIDVLSFGDQYQYLDPENTTEVNVENQLFSNKSDVEKKNNSKQIEENEEEEESFLIIDKKRSHRNQKQCKTSSQNQMCIGKQNIDKNKKYVCNKTFPQKSQKRPHECDICKKVFKQKSHLTVHKVIHSDKYPYICDMCNKPFKHKSALDIHTRLHTGEKPFGCDICNKKFSQKPHLVTHKRVHTGEKPYACDTCYKTFTQKSHLMSHKRLHTGEKPYACDMCYKTFAHKNALVVHKRLHTGEKPFACDMCNKKFAQKPHLVSHKRVHTGEKPYACEICDKVFINKSTLVVHKRLHTS